MLCSVDRQQPNKVQQWLCGQVPGDDRPLFPPGLPLRQGCGGPPDGGGDGGLGTDEAHHHQSVTSPMVILTLVETETVVVSAAASLFP